MLQTINKSEMAKRKPYTYSQRTLEKMRRIRKEKQIKKEKLSKSVSAINILEFDQDILCDFQNKVEIF